MITNYGAHIVSLSVKNKDGEWVDVVIGFESLKDYLQTDEIYHGTIVGRYANRIRIHLIIPTFLVLFCVPVIPFNQQLYSACLQNYDTTDVPELITAM